MRFPDELKFDADMAQAVKISPQHIHESEAHDAAFREPIFPQASIPAVGESARSFKKLYAKRADLEVFGYAPDCVRCKHALIYALGQTNTPHRQQCRTRIAAALRRTEVGRRRLDEFEKRTNQQIAIEIQRDQNKLRMDAPDAQGKIVSDGKAAASSAAARPQFSDLQSHAEPSTVTAAGNHHRQPRHDEPAEEPSDDTPRAMTPEGRFTAQRHRADHQVRVCLMMIPWRALLTMKIAIFGTY